MPVKMLKPGIVVLRAADRADAFAAVEVLRRLMLAHAVRARPQAGELVLAVGVGVRRGDDVAVARPAGRSARLRACGADRRSRSPGPSSAWMRPRIEPGSSSPKLYSTPICAPVDHDLADHVARRRNVGHAAEVARRVDAVEPAGRMDFHDRYLPAAQVVELVEAVARRSSRAGPCRCRWRRAASARRRRCLLPVPGDRRCRRSSRS